MSSKDFAVQRLQARSVADSDVIAIPIVLIKPWFNRVLFVDSSVLRLHRIMHMTYPKRWGKSSRTRSVPILSFLFFRTPSFFSRTAVSAVGWETGTSCRVESFWTLYYTMIVARKCATVVKMHISLKKGAAVPKENPLCHVFLYLHSQWCRWPRLQV